MNRISPLLWSALAAALMLLVCFGYGRPSANRLASPKTLHGRTMQSGHLQTRPPLDPASVTKGEKREAEDDPLAREQWQLMRHGFHLGVPKDAYAKAMNQRLKMEAESIRAMGRRVAAAEPGFGAPSPGFWTFIG